MRTKVAYSMHQAPVMHLLFYFLYIPFVYLVSKVCGAFTGHIYVLYKPHGWLSPNMQDINARFIKDFKSGMSKVRRKLTQECCSYPIIC